MRSNMRWIWRLRPSTSVISYQGFFANRISRMETGLAKRPSSLMPARSFWMASLLGIPLTFTS